MIYIRGEAKAVYSLPNHYRYTVCERDKETPDGVYFNVVEVIYNTTKQIVHSSKFLNDFALEDGFKYQDLNKYFTGSVSTNILNIRRAYRAATFQDLRVREIRHLKDTYLLFQVDDYENRLKGSELLIEERLDGLHSVEFAPDMFIKETYNHSEPMYSFNNIFQKRYIGFYKKHLTV